MAAAAEWEERSAPGRLRRAAVCPAAAAVPRAERGRV